MTQTNTSAPIVVFLESPLAGDVDRNISYARQALWHCITLGEAPFASHFLYTQVLDDLNPLHRAKGLECAAEWRAKAFKLVVYVDHGISYGMSEGIAHAEHLNIPIEYRRIYQS